MPKVTILPAGLTVDVAKGTTLLAASLKAGARHGSACGGVCACSTCHVKVIKGLESCSEPTDDELDQLDEAPDISLNSRLGCQCVPNGTTDIEIEIPAWNKNLVKEGH